MDDLEGLESPKKSPERYLRLYKMHFFAHVIKMSNLIHHDSHTACKGHKGCNWRGKRMS